MNSKSTKAKRKAIPGFTLAELDQRDGVERFEHLMDAFDKYFANEERRASGPTPLHGRNDNERRPNR
ncbi:hypothetical protein BQ8794_10185 [Mesorhizobium prunaredense]|uniref:Uncharacterized protein n=1 Tax=Mesorhizobium prunaredense TaxID=1631249 RepID=A0A1R3UYU8_9HYPH|nr:hypothetical protein [Mesorhizobium prunaredense]SIT52815.1 hypothetical protein BQ8794_10185 [Mesorhizobium prunaredense]